MLKYSEHIPFELGVKLKEAGYWNPRCTYETNYNDPCYFIPSKKFYGEGVVADWNDIVPARPGPLQKEGAPTSLPALPPAGFAAVSS